MLVKYKNPPINTKLKLAQTLSISESELESLLSTPDTDRYSDPKKPAFKKDGTKRKIKSPNRDFRRIQGRINNRIFLDGIIWPSYLFGSIPAEFAKRDTDYIACALKHCRAKSILKIDISNFFDNISEYYVEKMFLELFRFDKEVSECLANLCCYKGNLVQGARTSSYIALLILWDKEHDIVRRLAYKQLKYTRLVDDITVSSEIANFDFNLPSKLIEQMLLDKDLPSNVEKHEESYISTSPLIVHGVRVTFDTPTLTKKELMNIKAAVHNLSKIGSEVNNRKQLWYRKQFNRCQGRVNKLARTNCFNKQKKLIKKLKSVSPLANFEDIKYLNLRVEKLLEDEKTEKVNSYQFYKRYNIAIHRAAFIKRCYPKESRFYLDKLRSIKPGYDNKDDQ